MLTAKYCHFHAVCTEINVRKRKKIGVLYVAFDTLYNIYIYTHTQSLL